MLAPRRDQDHPRRCGENYGIPCNVMQIAGSPPQVRGKPELSRPRRRKGRITPAGAGKTYPHSAIIARKEDHPRRCGENRCIAGQLGQFRGSPPQVRGKLDNPSLRRGTVRITPAGAGKTLTRALRNSRLRDHPRRCGENRASPYPTGFRLGSPPQVRGKH